MSTPLLPEIVPEIDANLVSFYGGGGSGQAWKLTRQSFLYIISKWPSYNLPTSEGG